MDNNKNDKTSDNVIQQPLSLTKHPSMYCVIMTTLVLYKMFKKIFANDKTMIK